MGILPDWMIKAEVKIEPFSPMQQRPGVISYGVTSYGYDIRLGYQFKVFRNTFCGVVDPKQFDEKAFENVDLTPRDMVGTPLFNSAGEPMDNDFIERLYNDGRGQSPPAKFIMIPPNSFALGESLEEVTVPRSVLAVCVGKSTYARCGIIVNVTPLEPEWHGKITIEISNTSPLPAKVYCGEGIMQVMFLRSDGYRELHAKDIANLYRELHGSIPNPEYAAAVLRDYGTCKVSYADKKGRYQNQTGLTLPFVEGEKK